MKSRLNIKQDSCTNNAKILLKKENGEIQLTHYTEKARSNIGEEMHATLFYTRPRGLYYPETLSQFFDVLFKNYKTPPKIETIANTYSAIIKPSWRFKISEVVISKNDKSPSFITAKLLFNEREHVYKDNKPISTELHMTLVNCADSSIFSNPIIVDKLVRELNKKLQNRMIKIAKKNGVADLEFGISNTFWRIRGGEKIEFKK